MLPGDAVLSACDHMPLIDHLPPMPLRRSFDLPPRTDAGPRPLRIAHEIWSAGTCFIGHPGPIDERWAFTLVLAGGMTVGRIGMPGIERQLEAGWLHVAKVHPARDDWLRVDDQVEVLLLVAGGGGCNRRLTGVLPVQGGVFQPVEPDLLADLFRVLLRVAERGVRHHAAALEHSLVESIVAALQQGLYQGSTDADQVLHRRCLDWCAGSTPQGWTVAHAAQALGVDRSHLSRVFRRCHGCTLDAYVRQARLNHAAQLLRATALPLKAIAEAVGYADHYAFAKAFRQHYRQPPGAFRRALR